MLKHMKSGVDSRVSRRKSVCFNTTCSLLVAAWMGIPSPITRAETDIRRDSTVNAIEQVIPSVVNIGTETVNERRGFFEDMLRDFYGPYWRQRPSDVQYSLGSGVIIDEEGYILTNMHVVQGSERIWVALSDGRKLQAKLISGTQQTDVALLKIDGKPGEKFKAAHFAADDDLLLGETVIALGNPFGLGVSASRGILSSKTRRPPSEHEPLDIKDWIQTDAAINPGSSGGPLINLKGDLIGINVAVYREGQGIGFAIPIRRVGEAISDIFTPEAISGMWFGARLRKDHSAIVMQDIDPSSPAGLAGLENGDKLLKINDKSITSLIEASQELAKAGKAHDTKIVFQRKSEKMVASVRLIPEKSYFNAGLIRQKLGLTVQKATDETAQSLGVNAGAMVVSAVDEKSPAAEAGIQAGMIINGIEGKQAGDLVEFARLLYARKKGEQIALNVVVQRRRGNFVEMRQGTVGITLR